MKPVSFLGDSLDVIRSFPVGVRRTVGYQIERVQRGLEFQKRSQTTSKRDLELPAERLKKLIWRLGQ